MLAATHLTYMYKRCYLASYDISMYVQCMYMYMYRCILLKMLGQGVMEPVKVWEAVGGLTIKAFASLLVCKSTR